MLERKIVAVSGGFDPIHIGHVRMFEEAKKLGDELMVILNNDNWLMNKKGFVFMPEHERREVIESIKWVDRIIITSHQLDDPTDAYHRSISRELKKLDPRPTIFANGGDRDEKNATDPESSLHWDIKTCEELGIEMVYNIGRDGKVQSSSWLTERVRKK